jgi:hypothetical protein
MRIKFNGLVKSLKPKIIISTVVKILFILVI